MLPGPPPTVRGSGCPSKSTRLPHGTHLTLFALHQWCRLNGPALCLLLAILGLQEEQVGPLTQPIEVYRHPVLLLFSVVGLVFLLLVVACALLAPLIAPYDPVKMFTRETLSPPSVKSGWGLTSMAATS